MNWLLNQLLNQNYLIYLIDWLMNQLLNQNYLIDFSFISTSMTTNASLFTIQLRDTVSYQVRWFILFTVIKTECKLSAWDVIVIFWLLNALDTTVLNHPSTIYWYRIGHLFQTVNCLICLYIYWWMDYWLISWFVSGTVQF